MPHSLGGKQPSTITLPVLTGIPCLTLLICHPRAVLPTRRITPGGTQGSLQAAVDHSARTPLRERPWIVPALPLHLMVPGPVLPASPKIQSYGFDCVRIDHSLVHKLRTDRKAGFLISGMVMMAKGPTKSRTAPVPQCAVDAALTLRPESEDRGLFAFRREDQLDGAIAGPIFSSR